MSRLPTTPSASPSRDVLTAETVAVKLALVAPAATVTDAGTVTALLLLDRLTAWPPVPAAAFSVTVQASVPAPVIDPLVQLSPLSTGCPVPLRAMVMSFRSTSCWSASLRRSPHPPRWVRSPP